MKEIQYITRRIILTKEERRISSLWGSKWRKIVNSHLKKKTIHLIIGEWSGYNSSQRRIVHTSLAPENTLTGFLGTTIVTRQQPKFQSKLTRLKKF